MKRLIGKIVLISALSLLPVMLYNFIYDPYFVLRHDVKSMRILPNERWVKTRHLLNNPDKYDALLLGSSRVSQIPIDYMNRVSGRRYYNMTLMAGVPTDYVQILTMLMKHKVGIRKVVIGLDYYSFEGATPKQFHRGIMYLDDPWARMKQYLTYLFLPIDSNNFFELRFDNKDIVYDIFGTGEYTFVRKERNMDRDPAKHRERFSAPIFTVCSDRLERTLNEIRQIIEVCRAHNIETVFFINPEYAMNYLCDDIAFLNRVRERFAGVTDFWDFTRPTAVTENMFNFVDFTHYRKSVGKMMAAKMLNAPGDAPADFGRLVTKAQAGAYVKETVPEYQARKKALNPNCAKCLKAIWD